MEDLFDSIRDFFNDGDHEDIADEFVETGLDEVHSSIIETLTLQNDFHSDNIIGNFADFSDSHNVSFQGKSVDDLFDRHKTIKVKSAGGGGTYSLDVYNDENGKIWVARHGSKTAECINGCAQVNVGVNIETNDIKAKL